MTSILFVCHGNICRSTMAQSIMHYLATRRGCMNLRIDSAGTSDEEEGNPVHPGTRSKLQAKGIPCVPHRARQLTLADARSFDLLVGMDSANLRNMKRMLPASCHAKVMRLLDGTPHPRDIADPWYTGDFDQTYQDIMEGCAALLERLCSAP